MRRIRIPLLLLLILPSPSISQSLGITIAGTVSFRGARLPNAVVTVTNEMTGTARSIVTDDNGRYTLGLLPPGPYVVSVSIPGFKVYREKIELSALTASETLNIEIGEGPVPVTGGQPPTAPKEPPQTHADSQAPLVGPHQAEDRKIPQPSRARTAGLRNVPEVVEETFVDEMELKKWLDEQKRLGKMLLTIVPLKDKTSLFVLTRGRRSAFVVSAVQTLSAEDLQSRINEQRKRVFLGLHRLTGSLYMMVFRDGN